MHSVTDRQTDGETDDIMVPSVADHIACIACTIYDQLK